eukprot:50433-Chlamydomonas_euryale.AAC.1
MPRDAGDEAPRGALLLGTAQRHNGLRGSCRAGASRGGRRGGGGAARPRARGREARVSAAWAGRVKSVAIGSCAAFECLQRICCTFLDQVVLIVGAREGCNGGWAVQGGDWQGADACLSAFQLWVHLLKPVRIVCMAPPPVAFEAHRALAPPPLRPPCHAMPCHAGPAGGAQRCAARTGP